MDSGKLAIFITAAAFTGFGTALLAKPDKILGTIGIKARKPAGRTELRAMYGGMELGLGGFFTVAALKEEYRRPALLAILCGIGGLGATRIATAIAHRDPPLTYLMGAPEITAATLAAISLLRDTPGN